jgi:hypothetical protein
MSGWAWLWLALGAWCVLSVIAAFAWSMWRGRERYRAHADQAIALTQEQR